MRPITGKKTNKASFIPTMSQVSLIHVYETHSCTETRPATENDTPAAASDKITATVYPGPPTGNSGSAGFQSHARRNRR